jgi:hypothetical protein
VITAYRDAFGTHVEEVQDSLEPTPGMLAAYGRSMEDRQRRLAPKTGGVLEALRTIERARSRAAFRRRLARAIWSSR